MTSQAWFTILGEALTKEAPKAQFAAPVEITHKGRRYWSLSQTGEVHGLDTLCAYDEHNEEFILWDGGSPYLDWSSTALEEADYHNGAAFDTIAELIERMHNPED